MSIPVARRALIRQARELYATGDYTVRSLGEHMGIGRETVRRWVKGHGQNPRSTSLLDGMPVAFPYDAFMGGARRPVDIELECRDAIYEGPDGFFPWERR